MLAILALISTDAHAGSGPWTLNAGQHNIYLGADYFRFSRFDAGGDETQDLGIGLSAGALTSVWTLGMANHVEAEFTAAYEGVRVTQPGDGACAAEGRPNDWCDSTSNIGDLAASVKWRVMDELNFRPVSIAISARARSGEAYANTRRRLTTLGDGTTDVGASLSVGRTATVGDGWYQASATVGYWYRFPNVREDDGKVPADDVEFDVQLLWSPHPTVGFGPVMAGFQRLGGIALADVDDFFDYDAFNRLRARQIKVGGKLGVYSVDNGPTVSLAVLQTVHAENNPTDTLAISVGVGWFVDTKKPE